MFMCLNMLQILVERKYNYTLFVAFCTFSLNERMIKIM